MRWGIRCGAAVLAVLILVAAAAGCAAGPGAGGAASRPADLVLRGGAVYTLAEPAWAGAVAVTGGRIVWLGDTSDAARWIGAGTRVVELEGRMVLPAFHDSHVHPIDGGIELGECDLNGLATAEEVLARVAEYAAAHPDLAWIRGGGWDLPLFPGANPRRWLLDAIVPERPVYLSAADGHSAWVNTKALELAGITRVTDDPPDGRIERDEETGAPTGTLRETAMELVAELLPEYRHEDRVAGLRRALELAARFGITTLHDARTDEPWLRAYAELAERGELTARIVAALLVRPAGGTAEVGRLSALRARYTSERLAPRAAKIFVDGVIEAHTAALIEPYVDQPEERGTPRVTPEALAELATALDRTGFQLHLHAIGDRAARMSLDAIEAAREANGRRDARHLIAHLQLVDPVDIPRFRELDVTACFQPLWAYPDPYITELTEPVLGPERSRWLYAMRTFVESGALLAGGSDWTVSSMNPLDAIQVAVTRRALDAGPGPAWYGEELITLEAAIAAYTIDGARANFQEDKTGSIEPGKAADLIVLERNLFEVAPHEIHDVRVVSTLLAGEEVFAAEGAGERGG